ncbi:hypothetical protein BKP54_32295 [Ensifer sp. 1H6]|nr:hypothetical protein BKP54_32295 [Ensifer sp. 1H6]
MAILECTLPSTDGAVGFELPIFRSRRGANSDIVQKIDQDGTVGCFQPSWLSTRHAISVGDLEIYVGEGEQAIWAFRTEQGRLIAGTRSQLVEYGINALKSGELEKVPLVAAEMAAFCECQEHFPWVLERAFAHLASTSETSAASWRDVSVLLPAIKEDVASHYRPRGAAREKLNQLLVLTLGETIAIHGPKELVSEETPLSKFRPLAEAFGINRLRFVPFTPALAVPKHLVWQLVGTGGVAGHALTTRPFRSSRHLNRGGTETYASGDAEWANPSQPELIVRIHGSNIEDAEHANRALALSEQFLYRHAINIRPMSYGTPRTSTATTPKIFSTLSEADMVWIIAAHRLRQTGTPMNGMGGMHTASRTLSCALQALVGSVVRSGSKDTFLQSLRNRNALGMIGIWRYNNDFSLEDNIKRLIFNMLCEDVLLESADCIRVMWSMKNSPIPASRVIELGARHYNVEFVQLSGSGLGATLVGFGIDVALSSGKPSDFREFCIDLFAGYGWWHVALAESGMTMQRGTNTVRVILVTDTRHLARAARSHHASEERMLIVTNKTVPKNFRNRTYSANAGVVHYSEIGRWLGSVFGDKLVGDR